MLMINRWGWLAACSNDFKWVDSA